MKHLEEVYNASRNRKFVYENWGFDQKLSLGKGLNVLFTGPSGTGKTMAAEIIAHELGVDFYKIDLSSVVSKYIGETEKNLSLIFSEAETANAILFFDEADALFGKRSEVSDAHDRYANIETAYLLQKMEEYTGVVFLATNLDKNMDEAFSRRMHFVVEFSFPNIKERQSIWEKVWPEKTPLDGLDLVFMARQFELTGGNIKNIALSAAFLAASEKALRASHAWISTHFNRYLEGPKQTCYTLYSLEKAGDLGIIARFGSHDWYAEGAARLLALERPKGGWGSSVDTALALLFLTRANRPFATGEPLVCDGTIGILDVMIAQDVLPPALQDTNLNRLASIAVRRHRRLVSCGDDDLRVSKTAFHGV